MPPMKHTVIEAREPIPQPRGGPDRRDALKLMASSIALIAAGCSRPAEQIVPYVNMPERMVPGEIMRFATAVPLAGYGRGAIALTHQGRPVKLEGNPRHPASLGSTDIFLEATVLSLYDPDRSQNVRHRDLPIATWDGFARALDEARSRIEPNTGKGLHILTGRVTSPTLIRQMQALKARYPDMAWHRYEPINDDNAMAGAKAAFGRKLQARPDLAKAEVVWCLGADPLGPGPEQPRNAHDFAAARRARGKHPDLNRLYVTESTWSLTGANADHRLALAPHDLHDFALAVAQRCGIGIEAPPLTGEQAHYADAIAADLRANHGRALVLAGDRQPPEHHALVHALNHALTAPVGYLEPLDPVPETHGESLAALAHALEAGMVDTLLMIGTNPVYDTGLPFADLIAKARLSAHLSLYDDETSAVCDWQLPQTHVLEDWSDLRGPDGTAAIVQPLITPLFDTRDAHQLVAMLLGDTRKPYAIVRETWSGQGRNFEEGWRKVLEAGVIAGTAPLAVTPGAPKLPDLAPAAPQTGLALAVLPDPSIYDGQFANNAWLQECPKPVTFEVWGNSFGLSPADAKALAVESGDGLRVSAGHVAVEGPVQIHDSLPKGVIMTTLGHGRSKVGAIGNGVGFRVAALAAAAERASVKAEKLGRSLALYTAHRMGEMEAEPEQKFPDLDLVELAKTDHIQEPGEPQTILGHVQKSDGYDWAMVIDASACIGCNACVVSCQAENNVGVVGPEQIAMGREMHWIRIDSYDTGRGTGFQPVPCMQCEKAPCEPVCPVEASIHDTEGLNVQVYNRCIGTRFCEANCPYKVRRFNWFGYTSDQQYADLGAPLMQAVYNPDVTVRSRGVMEKCTYCVQRITRARRKAEEENRRIHAHEVVTACQAACPTQAIHFGNLDDKNADINYLRKEARHYTLMKELGTRPRTTYLAKLFNLNPALKGEKA